MMWLSEFVECDGCKHIMDKATAEQQHSVSSQLSQKIIYENPNLRRRRTCSHKCDYFSRAFAQSFWLSWIVPSKNRTRIFTQQPGFLYHLQTLIVYGAIHTQKDKAEVGVDNLTWIYTWPAICGCMHLFKPRALDQPAFPPWQKNRRQATPGDHQVFQSSNVAFPMEGFHQTTAITGC